MTKDPADSEHKLSRRSLLGALPATAAGLALDSLAAKAAPQRSKEDVIKAEHDKSGTNPIGPANAALSQQNPDSVTPPPTDHGNVPPFKYPFSFSHKRTQEGGWARQVTVEDLPISKSIAGVNMRLTAGGIRELHWHQAAEWAFMLYGSARITAIDTGGQSFVDDVREGDIWNFPSGIPHSIQGLAPDGCEFLLVFDDGAFSEYETTSLTDLLAHTPPSALVKSFGVPPAAFSKIPSYERYIFQGEVPGPLEADQRAATGRMGRSKPFDFRLTRMEPNKRTRGGEVRIVDSKNFPASTTIAAALVTVHPGGIRELHWHPNADEWQYYIKGSARMTVFAAGARARTMDFQRGDVGYIQKTFPHYIENTGDGDLSFLEMFRSDHYADISLSNWLSHTPPQLVAEHLGFDRATLDAIPKDEVVVMPL
ncbi:MAG: cupin domain-containing protein [Candidatus Acidiferrales bacterium]